MKFMRTGRGVLMAAVLLLLGAAPAPARAGLWTRARSKLRNTGTGTTRVQGKTIDYRAIKRLADIGKLTFPAMRRLLRSGPPVLGNNPCAASCSYMSYITPFYDMPYHTAVHAHKKNHGDTGDFKCKHCVSREEGVVSAAATSVVDEALLREDPYANFFSAALLQRLRAINAPNSTAGPLCFEVVRNGIGNQAWVWGAGVIMSLLTSRPLRIVNHMMAPLPLHEYWAESAEFRWVGRDSDAAGRSVWNLKPSAIEAIAEAAEDGMLHLSNAVAQDPIVLLEEVREYLMTNAKAEELDALLTPSIAALFRSSARSAMYAGEMIFLNAFVRPTARFVREILPYHSALVHGANGKTVFFIGVHLRTGVGAEQKYIVQSELDIYRYHLHKVKAYIEAYYARATIERNLMPVVYVASDRVYPAELFCSSLRYTRCMHFVAQPTLAGKEGHVFEARAFAEHDEQALATFTFDFVRDLFLLSLSDGLVGTVSTFSEAAANWGGLPSPLRKLQYRFKGNTDGAEEEAAALKEPAKYRGSLPSLAEVLGVGPAAQLLRCHHEPVAWPS